MCRKKLQVGRLGGWGQRIHPLCPSVAACVLYSDKTVVWRGRSSGATTTVSLEISTYVEPSALTNSGSE